MRKGAIDHRAALDATITNVDDVLLREASRPPRRPLTIDGGDHTQAETLIQLAEPVDLFHTPERRPYATVPVGNHWETWPLRHDGFRLWLTKRYYDREGKPPGKQGLDGALDVLQARAVFDGPQRRVCVRAGQGDDGAIYFDLGTPDWIAVKVTASGWELMSEPPIRFRRPNGLAALPVPMSGGSLEQLRELVNLPDDDQWALFLGWLVAALWPRGPYPILVIEGEQGSAKTGLARVCRALIDPCSAPLRSAPREERDLMIAATNGLIVAYDNLSHVKDWLSDALCRLSTGGGMSARGLYTNDEEFLFEAQRPILLTGIANLCERDDLRDRALILTLGSIPETRRRDEAALWAEFNNVRSRVLGVLLDAVSCAMQRIDGVHLERLPRMADFARLVTAAEPALGLASGDFLRVYDASRADAVEASVEFHPVAKAVRDFAPTSPAAHWIGTATELLTALNGRVSEQTKRERKWPGGAAALSTELTRIAPALRKLGVAVRHKRSGKSRRIEVWGGDDDAGVESSEDRPRVLSSPAKSRREEDFPSTASMNDDDDVDFPRLTKDEVEERLAIQEEGQAA